eukprot:508406-Prorocentrum_minimum.AAC.2
MWRAPETQVSVVPNTRPKRTLTSFETRGRIDLGLRITEIVSCSLSDQQLRVYFTSRDCLTASYLRQKRASNLRAGEVCGMHDAGVRVPALAGQVQLARLGAVEVSAHLHQVKHSLCALAADHLHNFHVAEEIAGHHSVGGVAFDRVEGVEDGTDSTLCEQQIRTVIVKVKVVTTRCPRKYRYGCRRSLCSDPKDARNGVTCTCKSFDRATVSDFGKVRSLPGHSECCLLEPRPLSRRRQTHGLPLAERKKALQYRFR